MRTGFGLGNSGPKPFLICGFSSLTALNAGMKVLPAEDAADCPACARPVASAAVAATLAACALSGVGELKSNGEREVCSAAVCQLPIRGPSSSLCSARTGEGDC